MVENKQLMESIFHLIPEFESYFIRPYELITRDTVSGLQVKILFLLSKKEKYPMGELAGQLEISRPQLTGLIDGLVRIGFVERTGGTTDRRVISVRLTPRAEEFLRQTQQEAFRRYSIRLDRLDEEEKALLLTSLQNVRRLLAKTETDDALPQKE